MKKPMEQALEVAEENLRDILTVTEWANEMNYKSLTYYSRQFRNYYGVRPKKKLIELRLQKFFTIIKNESDLSCYEIAVYLGLTDEKKLNRFIRHHTGKPPTEWKKR